MREATSSTRTTATSTPTTSQMGWAMYVTSSVFEVDARAFLAVEDGVVGKA